MAKEINQDQTTGTSVAGETVKGAAKGAGITLGAGLAVVAGAVAAIVGLGVALLAAPVITVGVGAAALLVGAALYSAAPILATGAAIGGGYALYKGMSKMRSEQKALEAQANNRDQALAETIKMAQQQAFQAGVGAGQVHVIQELQKVQAAQLAQTQEKEFY